MAQSLTPNLNIIQQGLTLPSLKSLKRAADITGGYALGLEILYMLNYNATMGQDSISTADGKRSISRMGTLERSQPVLSRTLSGANIVLVFQDPSYSLYRVDDVLVDTVTGIYGKVVSSGAGTATLSPMGTAFNLLTHYLPGKYVSAKGGVTSKTFASTSPVGIYTDPTHDFNYTSITRDGESLARRAQANSTSVQYGAGGWWHAYEPQMVTRIMSAVERGLLDSPRFTDGITNTNGGLDWLIANRGGTTVSTATPPTLDDINDYIRTIVTANASPIHDIFCWCGYEFLSNLQKLTTTNSRYITNLGQRDEINGKNVVDYNVTKYSIMGVTVSFMLLPALNDRNFWHEPSIHGGLKKSWTAYFLNLAPIPVVGGGTVPALELFYYNENPIMYGYVEGTVTIDGMASAGTLSTASLGKQVNLSARMNTSTDVDSVQAWMLVDIGIDARDTKAMLKVSITS